MIIKNSVLLLKSQNSNDDIDKYEQILKSNKLDVKQVKTLVFNFKNLNSLKVKLENCINYSGIIFSSPRCVQAVHLASENSLFEKWRDKTNFSVGEETCATALKKLNLVCDGKESGNALCLSKVILQNKTQYTKPFLFPHGNLKTDTLSLELEKEGLSLDSVEVYDTIPNPKIEADLNVVTDNLTNISEFVVFFSPSGFTSTIGHIKRLPEDLNEVKFIAIGPVTETAIKEQNFNVYRIATKPNPQCVLEAILGT
ncbi:uroporphyrinogen-III synthase-like [Sitophilus oryzae]|uniref:Uroporphyrinogen-III synthase n=1 Tax=Sitophilus oryzae TaxID=7048 RepID=A0A6J2YVR1_SITOR|nr:uroporphyrinogen-III synthase-like [Sitophilus oryzae]